MDKHSTNWTMDGLPIEGGFDVAAAEEDFEEEDEIEEEEGPDKEGGIRRSSRTASQKTAGGEEDYDEGWDQAWADAQHGNLPDPEDFTGTHSIDWEAGYQDYLLFGDRDESLPWDPDEDEDDPNWMPGFDGGTVGKVATEDELAFGLYPDPKPKIGDVYRTDEGDTIEIVEAGSWDGECGRCPYSMAVSSFKGIINGDSSLCATCCYDLLSQFDQGPGLFNRKMVWKKSSKEAASEPHCESCGSTDYEDLNTGDQGYTACCNEPICYGGYSDRFGTPEDYKTACCWAKANEMFEAEGRQAPDGSYRLAGKRQASLWLNPTPGMCNDCGKKLKGDKIICKKCAHKQSWMFSASRKESSDEVRSRLSSDDLKEAMVEVYDKWELANAKGSPECDTLARTYLVLDDELTRRGMVLAEDDSADDQQEGLPWLEDVELETLETKE